MRTIRVPSGSPVLLGAPARPLDAALARSVGSLATSIQGVKEAHLPECFLMGVMEAPAQVLVVVHVPEIGVKEIERELDEGLRRLLPPGMELDVWSIPYDHPLLQDIRSTGCQIP